MREHSIVGKRAHRDESVPKATGAATFAMDMSLPGMLHGKVLMSPHAHARILNIDTGRAKTLPGVKGIITAADIPDRRKLVLLGPDLPTDQYVLARGVVRYIGEPVAAVAAVDEETAEEALDLIRVDYELLPAVFDPEDAMRPGAVQLHDHAERNVAVTNVEEYGDIEKGLADCDYVREDTFKWHEIAYMHPEVENALASWDSIAGKLTVWASTQGVYSNRKGLAHLLDLPWTKVRVIAPFVGGGYGGKFAVTVAIFCAAALAKKIGKPVKFVNTREQQFTMEWLGRQLAIFRVKTGAKRDGTLVLRDATATYDSGAYRLAIAGPNPEGYSIAGLLGPFIIPNVRLTNHGVYTNRQQVGPFRDYGQYQAMWCVDLQMDMIAKDLGIDPLEIRLKNLVQPYTTTPLDWPIKTCGLDECLEKASEAVAWADKGNGMPSGRGKGLSTSWHWSGPLGGTPDNPLSSKVRVNADGTADLLQIGTEAGSGQSTTLRMLVAEGLGIPLEDVKKQEADSDMFLNQEGATSVSISALGLPTVIAAEKAKQEVLEVAADKLEANVQDLESKDGRVFVKGSPEKGMSFAEAARLAVSVKGPILAKGDVVHPWRLEHGPEWMAKRYLRFSNTATGTGMSFGAAAAEVDVDRETGLVEMRRLVHAYDVGFALNPLGVEEQLQGGAGMAAGFALAEEVLYQNGQVLNPGYATYNMLTASDMPNTVPIIVERDDASEGPYGAKELGMGASCAPGSAVASAIYDATGVILTEYPATPERILKALEDKELPR